MVDLWTFLQGLPGGQSAANLVQAQGMAGEGEAMQQRLQALIDANKRLGRPDLEGGEALGITGAPQPEAAMTPEQTAAAMSTDMPSGSSGGDAAAISALQGMSEQQRIEAKKQLYYAGLYPDGVRPVPSGTLDSADVKAMTEATTMGALNKTDWQQAIAQRAALGAEQGTPFSSKASGSDGGSQLDEAYQSTVTRLRAFAQANGLDLPEEYVAQQAGSIVAGQTSPDELEGKLRDTYVASAYPAWADQIKAGQNVSDLAAPYIGAMASTLGLPQSGVTVNDKVIQKALAAVDAKGNPAVMPMWQFKEQLKKDPRWQYTDQAWDEVGGLADGLLQRMGF